MKGESLPAQASQARFFLKLEDKVSEHPRPENLRQPSFIHSFIHSFINSFIHSLIHSDASLFSLNLQPKKRSHILASSTILSICEKNVSRIERNYFVQSIQCVFIHNQNDLFNQSDKELKLPLLFSFFNQLGEMTK